MEYQPGRDVVPVESPKSPEGVRTFRIRLHILRHAEKASPNAIEQEEDEKVPLTPRGRVQALERGRELDLKDAVASGGPRVRSEETALIASMHNEDITGEESFEELLEISRKSGKTHRFVNEKLDMPFKKGTPYHRMLNKAYEDGVYLKTLDTLYKSAKDKSNTTYAKQARNIAQIVERFARVATKMAERTAYEEEETGSREQVMGTHGSVAESFLAEVIKRIVSEEERQRFIEKLPNGFALTEGFDAWITGTSDGKEPMLKISFAAGKGEGRYAFDQEVPLSVVSGIIRDFEPKEESSEV